MNHSILMMLTVISAACIVQPIAYAETYTSPIWYTPKS